MQNFDLETLRHSASHIMASAVVELFPGTKLGIGPAIEDGFYYDFDIPTKISEQDLPKIEQKMQEIINKKYKFFRQEITKEEAIKLFKEKNEIYKLELLNEIKEDKVSIYTHNNFVDLCRGPHIESTDQLQYFKLISVSGAYWRGDEKNKQLVRIYGTAFFTKKELDEYLERLEEAKKRDHRKIGRDLELFEIFEEKFGSGLVFWLPKGATVRKIIEDYLKDLHIKKGYKIVYTPHIAKSILWEISGHLDFYSEYMFSSMDVEGQKYIIKPMNCPGHVLIYNSKLRSYKDLPIRYFEFGSVYRYERSGVLHGLMRVRGFTQDDAHIFCKIEDVENEIVSLLDTIVEVLGKFGFRDYSIKLSTRPQKYIGSLDQWQLAENSLKKALSIKNLNYEIDPGEGVFYGPKIDLKIKDAIGRLWQCSTIQVDFNLPKRFEVKYRDKDGQDKYVIMIHRALLGSLERFFAILIENYAGFFPFWLSPIQVVILCVSEKNFDYGLYVKDVLQANNFRVELDNTSSTLQYKIRNYITQKIPYIVVVGEKEKQSKLVSVRRYKEEETLVLSLEEFVDFLKKQNL